LKVDLSGRKKDEVFIWMLRGTGKEVYTSLSYSIPPPNYDNWQVQKSRHAAMEMMGTTVVWHKYLAKLEIHAYAAVMDGKSAPSIDYIKITTDEGQHAALKKDGCVGRASDPRGAKRRVICELRSFMRSEATRGAKRREERGDVLCRFTPRWSLSNALCRFTPRWSLSADDCYASSLRHFARGFNIS